MGEHKYTVDDDYEDLKSAVSESDADDKPALNSSKETLVAFLNGEADSKDDGDEGETAEEKRAHESANPYNPDAKEIVVGNTPQPTRNEDTPPPSRYAVEGNDLSGYVGVSPEYMTYANETDAPLSAEEGTPEAELEEKAKYDIETAPIRGGITYGNNA